MNILLLQAAVYVTALFVPTFCHPNIVLIITDDQDLILGGLSPMVKTQRLIANAGVTFTEAFVTTPICCPSRSSILTGQYQHNHHVYNNSLNGGCSNSQWQKESEPWTWPALLHNQGYITFYAGKYLNQYGHPDAGGTQHVPRGWDWWIGLEGNSRYYNYTLSVNGSSVFHEKEYLTDVIKTYGLEFLRQKATIENNFLMVLAPPAPHAPFIPEPKYDGYFRNVTAMKTPNFNYGYRGKHWLVQMPPSPLPDAILPELNRVYRQRWETLLSVDDMVEAIIMQLNSSGLLENTYVILTSDHGYHVGQYGLPWDKRQPYETDIRIPLLIRGPGLPQKYLYPRPVLNIDLGATFLKIAGLSVPPWMDGIPFLPLLNQSIIPVRKFLVEYYGEGDSESVSSDCSFNDPENLSECSSDTFCRCQDSKNNTYKCVRFVRTIHDDYLFCKFRDDINLIEAYNLINDPYQLTNIAHQLSHAKKTKYLSWLNALEACSGRSCNLPSIS